MAQISQGTRLVSPTGLARRLAKFSAGGRSASGVLSANVFNNVASLIVTTMAARVMSVAEFGRLALAVSVAMVLSIVLDFGLDVGHIRVFNMDGLLERERVTTTCISWKIAVLLVLAVLGVPLCRMGPQLFPGLNLTPALFYNMLLSGGLLSLWRTLRAAEQAAQRFTRLSRNIVVYAGLRCLFCAVVLLALQPSANHILVALYSGPLLVLSFVAVGVLRQHRGAGLWSGALLRQVASYGKWVGLSGLAFFSLGRLPQFALARTSSPRQLGLYGISLTFVAGLSLLNDAVRTVLIPRATTLRSADARNSYRHSILQRTPLLATAAAAIIVAGAAFQYVVLGVPYRPAIPVFLILATATSLTLYLGLFNTLIHSHGVPHLDAAVNVGSFALLLFILVALPLSAMSAAIVFATILMAGEVLLFCLVKRLDRRNA